MADPSAVTLHASAAEGSSGSSAAVDIGQGRALVRLLLDVSVVTGTEPSLQVTIETSPTGTGWRSVGTFDPVASAISLPRRSFARCERFVRASWSIAGGSPSFTFAVTGESHQIWCDMDELHELGLPEAALVDVSDHVKATALLSATDLAAGYLSKELPLTSWGFELRQAVAKIAAYEALTARGYDPDHPTDKGARQRYLDAIAWLKMVSDGAVELPVVDATPTDTTDDTVGGGAVYTLAPRGW